MRRMGTVVARLGFTAKLIIGLMLAGALLVVAVAGVSRWSFERGFVTYLANVDAHQVAPLAKTLSEDYSRHGSWAFLRRRPQVWQRLVGGLFRRHDSDGNTFARRPPPLQRPGLRAMSPLPDPTGLHARLRLLDADRRRVIGPPDTQGNGRLQPLTVNGATVGWLSISPLPLAANQLGAAFRERQLRAFTWIAVGALLVTPLLAFGLGRYLLHPLRRLTTATHALTGGDYGTRIPVRTRDELGRLAADFNRLAAVLERNERLRREAMADVSHELRTPLSLLRAEIEALQDGVRTCDAQRLGSLHATVQGLSLLVEDLYQLTLADTGALSHRKERCDLASLVEDAVHGAQEAFKAGSLTLETGVRGSLPVMADPRRLRQLLDNLLKNSVRYTDPGGRVVVRGQRSGPRVVLEVLDSAPGVDAVSLPRLFERFYRVEKSRSRSRGGAGLGLAIGRSIVEAHDGTIEARPSPLGGLSVLVTLPAAGAVEKGRPS